MNLRSYRTLGRSGLIVSPLALGTMTFGNAAWGSPDDESAQILDAYLKAGGNVIDTADVYSGGRSEALLGQLIADRKIRDQVVLATKFGFNARKGDPHAGGNGRKHIHQALEGSLRRLKTEYIDLYWLHVWDMVTPVEEVLQTLGDLVRAGQIRYFGLSDMPAWYAAKMATLAHAHHVPGPVAMQLEYSLVARDLEIEHAPAARDSGLGIVPWSPLAGGFLAGKYQQGSDQVTGQGRLSGSNPFQGPFTKFTARNWAILDALRGVAAEVGRPPAQVALAWLVAQPGVASTILGASRLSQLQDNLASLEITLTPEQLGTLNTAGAPATPFFTPDLRRVVFGGADVQNWDEQE
ncbi:aldo/keto reductase [Deinococcus sp. KSM4-11]|uniref:aldo/keto reductase n=1 Tax=Deinococcus sp. KSM4-11 TaxID=2568654 RepID=UPI0010A56EFE|nr:aldo/keto reductase [Deinococcus sp. KSM4-11]THF86612.1 aldo/keto reductase [Deinococcus sp. KSM4-11]